MLLPSTGSYRHKPRPDVQDVQECTIRNLRQHSSFLDKAVPISIEEYTSRRDRLAEALYRSHVDAFVLEPGYSFQYYANLSQTDWEPWEPEERPFLMVVQPEVDRITGLVRARTSFLAPHFEEARVRMLGMPFLTTTMTTMITKGQDLDLDIVVWEEDEDPYQVLRNATFGNVSGVRLMVDEEIRDFIVRGLSAVGFETVSLTRQVESVRQRKTLAEIELLRAVNTGTVEAVRQMRPCECIHSFDCYLSLCPPTHSCTHLSLYPTTPFGLDTFLQPPRAYLS